MRFAAVLVAALTILAPLRAGAAERAVVCQLPPTIRLPRAAANRSSSSPAAVFGACRACFSASRASRAPYPAMPAAPRRRRVTKTFRSGDTGHAESVEVTYDPKTVSLGELLRVYFSVAHDPTQLNRQGPDAGAQYRSAIFVANADQEKTARNYIAQLSEAKAFSAPIVTTLEPLKAFYPAEPYHQDYLVRHPAQPYIVYNDLPKIDDLKRLFPSLYRESPALTN